MFWVKGKNKLRRTNSQLKHDMMFVQIVGLLKVIALRIHKDYP